MIARVNPARDRRVVVQIGVVNDLATPDLAIVIVEAGRRRVAGLAVFQAVELGLRKTG
jgi:hypothetical protein